MWGVTIENEPSAGNQPKYEFNCLGFTKEIQKDFLVKDLGPALAAAGYGPDKLQVMIFDDQRDVIHEWAQYIFSDKEAAKLAAGTAFHWYQNNPQNIGNLKKALDADPTKFIINSEASVGVDKKENPNLGDWGNGLENTVRDIIDDLNNYVAGWVNWNMALDLQGGPNWAGLKAYAPILIDAANKIYYKQPAFYALGHISKFILPDSYKLDFKETTKIDRYQNTAAVRADGGVVVVIMNSSDDLVEINIEDAGQKLSHYVKPHTLQTYIYWL
ncbi:unnamed protein product [Oppiella nova]|uniref:Glucosylceramidase n=1 Tax=Oppiella nova TaxID=334625 RepID=A0A7R9QXI9_9ACAR|nr:unnamed protein product [Oppiella nova]CAG2177753.1 unnamed protein product [Oppiella nova]